MAGGFVLGEVLVLSKQVVVSGALSAAAGALLVLAAFGWPWRAAGKGGGLSFGKAVGRSRWIWLLPVFFLAGSWRADREAALCRRELELGLDGERVQAEGRVAGIAWKQDGLAVSLEQVRVQGERGGGELRRLEVFVSREAAEEFARSGAVGNQAAAFGQLVLIQGARNPGEFDYRQYARSRRQTFRMFGDSLQITENRVFYLQEGLRALSLRGMERLRQTFDEETAGILGAVILGNTGELSEQVRSLYQTSGIAHLLAVSGLHLSLVSLAVYGLLRRLGVGFGGAGAAGGAALAVYAVLTGSGFSVIRALVMALFGFAAACLGRTRDGMTALGVSAVLIGWYSPYALCQSGVQLSFAAVAGIFGLSSWMGGRGKGQGARQGFFVSLSMEIMTLPLVLYHFFQTPLYGMVLNLAVVPFTGILIGSGAAGMALGAVHPAAGRFAGGGAQALLWWYRQCCLWFSRLPGSLVVWGRPQAWQLGAWYGLMLGAAFWGKRRGGLGWLRRAAVAGAAFLVLMPVPVRGLRATFLDVGQGDGICLQTREAVILVDGGSTDEKQVGKQRLVPFLKSQGIRKIDWAVVSHGDQDHISGLTYLMESAPEIQVGGLILPAAGREDPAYSQLTELAQERGCGIFWMERGDQLKAGALSLTCLYPEAAGKGGLKKAEDRNEQSLVIRVDYGKLGLLLTGDMSQEGENRLLELEQKGKALDGIQVLKAAHHGSKFSNSQAWLEAVSPSWTVISYGNGNRYGHPHEEVLERLEKLGGQVLETGRGGALILETDKRGVPIRFAEYGRESGG